MLITTARKAFLKKGYKAVSMREISEKSGVGLSNIYNCDSKDELFKVVLTPFLHSFEKMMIEHSEASRDTNENFDTHDYGSLTQGQAYRPIQAVRFFYEQT